MDLKDMKQLMFDNFKRGEDEVMLWVQCPKYQDEVIDVKVDTTEDSNGKIIKHVTFLFGDKLDMYYGDLNDDLYEYSSLIDELSIKEVDLFKLKEEYQIESDKIINETDFKELYGKNNAEVRKNHVKEELKGLYLEIKDLEFSIDYIGRRIGYLKELIRTKRLLIEVKEYE
jgi:hypothetical protein